MSFRRSTLALLAVAPFLVAQAPHETDDGAEDEAHDAGAPHPSASASATPKPLTVPFGDGMLLLPGGKFTMGSSDKDAYRNEKPTRSTSIGPFWIDRTEVTVAAYRACVQSKQCAAPRKTSVSCTYDMGDPDLPMNCVHHQEADRYCRAMGKRLPHETEWEFAARGAQAVKYPWGGAMTSCKQAATLLRENSGRSCTGKRPDKVGAHPSNASTFGVLDLTGNVEEWTADWYVERPSVIPPSSGVAHVMRGGGFLSPPSEARTTSRDWGSALEAGANVGFRCVREP